MDLSTIKERLKEFIRYLGITVQQFENKCEFSNGYVNSIRNTPGADKIDRIIREYPNLNRAWLMTGEGEMLAHNNQNAQTTGVASHDGSDLEFHLVPLVPIEALAGSLVGFSESADLARCKRITCPQEADLAIQVSGDSMSPEIESGTLLYLRRINERTFIPYGHTLVLDTENGVVVKKLFPSEKEGYVTAESVNPKYPQLEIEMTSIYGIYRVIGKSVFTLTI